MLQPTQLFLVYSMTKRKPNYNDMGLASSMGPKLRQIVEEQLLADLKNYLPHGSDIKFDWSDSCIEGKDTVYLDGSIENFSGITLFDRNENIVAEGWMEFIHEGEFFLVFWDTVRTYNGNGVLNDKKPGIPEHIWQKIPADLKPNYKNERE
jgi:hypothetical protein